MGLLNAYLGLIDWPLFFLIGEMNWQRPSAVMLLVYRVLVSFIILYYLQRYIGLFVRRLRRKQEKRRLDEAMQARTPPGDRSFTQAIDATKHYDVTVKELKARKDYKGLGEANAALNKFKEAAKWFRKAGDRHQEAVMLARAGQTVKAAKLLLKQGDFITAGRFFAEKGKYADAAKAYERAGNLAFAAEAYFKGKRFTEAARVYNLYFEDSKDAIEQQVAVAEACLLLLKDIEAFKAIPGEHQGTLKRAIGQRFEQARRYDAAAKLLEEAGNLGRAGEVYVLGGNLREAARCFKSAGRERDAQQVTGRYAESQGNWRDAALAYTAAAEYLRAGECYAKAGEAVRAGECFEKAGANFRAGYAYCKAGKFGEAIRALQKVPESEKDFDMSRALLGRCFYELHDYEHCAAALDNHLTGKRVESGNKEYFYMLALAYEQIGKLEASRDILYKIRTVDTEFKDVSQRISTISSRMSMGMEVHAEPRRTYVPSGGANQQVVEKELGTRYAIESELGRGGMGVVYLARDTQLDRLVALKFIGNLIDNSPEFRERFIREARAAAKISHPNIIAIYDISATEGKSYIAMEYVEGSSLSRYIDKKGPLPAREAVNIVGQACAALAAIHEAGIVHRDIKPDNILLGKGGIVKLTDFGLAKANDHRLTRTGTAMGTPSYMAPEQVLGKEADARSDIYSMGLVLHETLTGKLVFGEGNVLERQLKETPQPPGAFVADIPPALDAIVMQCVEKEPEARFLSARALMDALRSL